MNVLFRCIVLSALLLPIGALAQAQLKPVDEAASVPEFFEFRAQLQAAVARRDLGPVLAALHPEVKLSFGGDHGLEGFYRLWRPDAPDSRLWEEMASVLSLGGGFQADGSFWAPYVFAKWPGEIDPLENVAITGSDVPVRAAADASAGVLGTLGFTTAEVADWTTVQTDWVKVRLPNGPEGFVARRFARSPIDYRIGFAKVDGRWKITSFVAGD